MKQITAKIPQNEVHVSDTVLTIPSEAVWMFHVIQVVLVVVGFDTEANCPSKADRSPMTAESEVQPHNHRPHSSSMAC